MSETTGSAPNNDSTVAQVVIVGGGLAGAGTAAALRDEGYDGSIVLFAAENHVPYDRPPLSKSYLRGESPLSETEVHPTDWYAGHDIDLRLGSAVTTVEREAHRVASTDGGWTAYDRLVLATGASPRRIDLPGADLGGVVQLRTVEDSDALRSALASKARMVIIGAGWIGLEVAAAAREAGSSVTVLESAEQPLLAVCGPTLGAFFATLHRGHGVDVRLGVQVASIEAAAGSRKVGAVTLADGTSIPADIVLVGIGATPNIDLAVSCGLDVDNGILVDAQGRSSDPDIFAVGDVANADTPAFGERLRVEHWANALDRPASVARGVLGQDGGFDKLPFFYSDQYDLGLEYSGHGSPSAEVVVRGDVDAGEFVAFWLEGDVVRAGMNVNVWDVQDDIQALITARTPVDRVKLADPSVPIAAATA
ncbi:MAG: FAD-dependent oxidoreductase [Lapillicoccus sp.]